MNKYIKAYSDIVCHTLPLHKSEVLPQEELADRFKILEELIQKEEPMKPRHIEKLTYSCGNCAMSFTTNKCRFVNYQYCDVCGQKIDWSDND